MQCIQAHNIHIIIKFDTTLPATSTVNVTPSGVSTTEGMQKNHTKL